MTCSLTVLNEVPEGFLETDSCALTTVLPGPTLIDIPGEISEPLFVSTLLHGNELSGLQAVQRLLSRYRHVPLPRRLLLFIGNVSAAAVGVRTLETQCDFNRVWPGAPRPNSPEKQLMKQVFDYAAAAGPVASIDFHNTTGQNPPHSTVNRIDSEFLGLARRFSSTIIHFDKPIGVQQQAMAQLCPAVTIECGKTGDPAGAVRAERYLETCLVDPPLAEPDLSEIRILRTTAIARVPAGLTFSFDGTEADIRFRSDIECLNFIDLKPGTHFGQTSAGVGLELEFETYFEPGITDYFDYAGGLIRLRRAATPAMLTCDVRAVELDCLCYLMHQVTEAI